MTAEQQTAFFADLYASEPFSQVKILMGDHGWYWFYVWTGDGVLCYAGPTLPMGLAGVANDLYRRYGNEI